MSNKKIYGECYVCNLELCGTVIEVAGRHYHNRCFYCCKCRKQLGKEEFRMRDERFFCIECYSKAFERICAECGNYITDDRYIEALHSFYHANHFVCFLCKKDFPDRKFVKKQIFYKGEEKTRPFCMECHKKVKTMDCHICHNHLGEIKAFDGAEFYHDFCWLRNHPEEDESGERIREAETRLQEEMERKRDEEEKRRKEQEEMERKLEEEKKKEEEEERKRLQEEERKRMQEERAREKEEEAKKEEEKRRREEEEKMRNEEKSRERDEEKRRRDEERMKENEEKSRERDEERRKKAEEKERKAEEERIAQEEKERRRAEEEERRRENQREMTEGYKTKTRQVNFYDDDDFTTVSKEPAKPEKIVPSVPSVPPTKPQYNPSSVMAMLGESYRPMKNNQPVKEVQEENDSVDEVPQHSLNADEYQKEQMRVKELPNEELKKYPREGNDLPMDVDPSRKEFHLADEDFEMVFDMDKKSYQSLPRWKQQELRRKAGLF